MLGLDIGRLMINLVIICTWLQQVADAVSRIIVAMQLNYRIIIVIIKICLTPPSSVVLFICLLVVLSSLGLFCGVLLLQCNWPVLCDSLATAN